MQGDPRHHLGVDAAAVREAADTEAKLATTVASGKILVVKAALKHLLDR